MMTLKDKSTITVLLALTLAGCGGGGGGGANTVTFNDVSILTSFSDGAGVVKTSYDDGVTAFFATPEVADVAAELRDGTTSSDTFTTGAIPSGSTTYANVVTGTITVGSYVMNVTGWEDSVSGAGIISGIIPGELNLGFTDGVTAYTSPPTGVHTYVGTHTANRRTSLTTPEVGTFSMTADFDSGLVGYSGSSSSSALAHSNMPLNVSSGSFAGTSGSFTWNGASYTSTMHGNFSGSNANGVHGVFWTNGSSGTYVGGFAGRKQ